MLEYSIVGSVYCRTADRKRLAHRFVGCRRTYLGAGRVIARVATILEVGARLLYFSNSLPIAGGDLALEAADRCRSWNVFDH